MTHSRGRRTASVLAGALTMCAVLLASASSAWAGVGLGVTPNIPTPNGSVVVGQTYPSSWRVVNISDDQQADDNITLNNLTLVPSCGVINSIDCPNFGFGGNPLVSAYDPDVFALSGTGVGRTGTPRRAPGRSSTSSTSTRRRTSTSSFRSRRPPPSSWHRSRSDSSTSASSISRRPCSSRRRRTHGPRPGADQRARRRVRYRRGPPDRAGQRHELHDRPGGHAGGRPRSPTRRAPSGSPSPTRRRSASRPARRFRPAR